jgi:iron complex outermembrane recepter protein
MVKRKRLLSATALFVLTSGGAWAPSVYAAEQIAAASGANSGEGSALMEIVVTAQRKEQSLQDVPISVAVVSSATLENLNIESAADIGRLVPSAHIQAEQQFLFPYLRNVGSDQSTAGNEPVVATYIDGVYVARLAPALLELNNVERIEVLQGPQGTLFGRNSAAGLIQIVTSDPMPGSALSVKSSVGYGNYETVQSKLYAAAGLSDTLAADVAFVSNNQNLGWGENHFNGSQYNLSNSFALRTKWVFLPGDETKIVFASAYTYDRGSIGMQTTYHSGGPRPDGSNGYCCGGSGLPPLYGFYDTDTDFASYHSTKSWDASLRVEQDIGFARLINILATRYTMDWSQGDYDYTPLFGQAFVVPDYDRQVTEEFQLQSKPASSLDWTVGVFFFNHRYGYYPDSTIAGDLIFGTPDLAIGVPAWGRTNSYAGYGQTTYPIATNLRLTLGVRYTDDRLSAGGTTNLQDYPSGTIITPGVPASGSSSNSNTSYKSVLDYTWQRDIMLYASVSRGYKSELYNIITFQSDVVKPERLDAYEVGLKSEFLDHRVRLNAAAFRYNIDDYQDMVINNALGSSTELTTAGGARVNGGEFSLESVATNNLTLRAAATYADAYFTDYAGASFYTVNPNPPYGMLGPVAKNAAGNQLPNAPKLSASAGFDYHVPIAIGSLSLVGNYSYQASHYWNPDNVIVAPAVGLLDASITLHGRNGLDLSLWGTNLTGKKYYTAEFEGSTPLGIAGSPAAPRLYGIRVGFKGLYRTGQSREILR